MINIKDILYGSLAVSVIMVAGVSTKYIYHCAKQKQYEACREQSDVYEQEYFLTPVTSGVLSRLAPGRQLLEGHVYVNAQDPREVIVMSRNDLKEFIEKGLTKKLEHLIKVMKTSDLEEMGISIPYGYFDDDLSWRIVTPGEKEAYDADDQYSVVEEHPETKEQSVVEEEDVAEEQFRSGRTIRK